MKAHVTVTATKAGKMKAKKMLHIHARQVGNGHVVSHHFEMSDGSMGASKDAGEMAFSGKNAHKDAGKHVMALMAQSADSDNDDNEAEGGPNDMDAGVAAPGGYGSAG